MILKDFLKSVLCEGGRFLPLTLKRELASRRPGLGYLMWHDGDVRFDRYLGDLSVDIDARYNIEREMFQGVFEPVLVNALRLYLRGGDTAVDVGANVGALSLAMAQIVEPNGRVFSFEPGLRSRKRLRSNFALNPSLAPVLTVEHFGLSESEGSALWREDPSCPGNAGLLSGEGESVPLTTLDHYFGTRPELSVNLIKVDTEGMELDVLRGGIHLLTRCRPAILFESSMEFETLLGAPVRREVFELLGRIGYQFLDPDSGHSVAYPHLPQDTLAVHAEDKRLDDLFARDGECSPSRCDC